MEDGQVPLETAAITTGDILSLDGDLRELHKKMKKHLLKAGYKVEGIYSVQTMERANAFSVWYRSEIRGLRRHLVVEIS